MVVLSASCEVDGLIRGSRGSPRVGGALAPVGALALEGEDAQLLVSGVVGGRPPSCRVVDGRTGEDMGRTAGA